MDWRWLTRGVCLVFTRCLPVFAFFCSVAILWPEVWHGALDEASRLYFGEENIPGMIAVLLPLHEVCRRCVVVQHASACCFARGAASCVNVCVYLELCDVVAAVFPMGWVALCL